MKEYEGEPKKKKLRVEEGSSSGSGADPARIESGILSKIPPELFPHILKFLSSEVVLYIYLKKNLRLILIIFQNVVFFIFTM